MIKVIELESKQKILDKLNEFKDSGWNLGQAYIQIVPTIYGKFLIYYDEKLDIKEI